MGGMRLIRPRRKGAALSQKRTGVLGPWNSDFGESESSAGAGSLEKSRLF